GSDHCDHGASGCAEVLTAELDLDGTIGMDVGAALAVVPLAAPGTDAESEAALDDAAAGISALVPVLFPIAQARGDVDLLGVDFDLCRDARTVVGNLQFSGAFEEELHRLTAARFR